MSVVTSVTSLRAARCASLAALVVAWLLPVPAARAGDRADAASEVVLQAMALLGVPYRWGGNEPSHGLDCSGLVRFVFKTVGIGGDLPRRSEEMRRIGAGVARADLRAGDIVFFNTLGHPFSHVAIYVGEGRFVHAPGKHGQVRVDDIEDRYWRARFNGARRLAPAVQTAPEVQPARSPRDWRLEDFPNGP